MLPSNSEVAPRFVLCCLRVVSATSCRQRSDNAQLSVQARGLTSVAQEQAGDVEDKKIRGLGGQEHPLRWTGIHAG